MSLVAPLRLRAWLNRHDLGALLAPGGGTALAISFKPGWGLVSLVALTVLFARVRHLRSFRSALFVGFMFGATFLGAHLWWLVDSIGVVAWVSLALIESLWFAAACGAIRLCRYKALWPLTTALIWTAAELLRQTWPLGGLPWGQLGVAALDTPFEALLPYVGVVGTTLGIALSAAVATQVTSREAARTWSSVGVAAASLSVLAVPLSGAVAVGHTESGPPIILALVQPGVPGDGRDVVGHKDEILHSSLEQTRELASVAPSSTGRVDLVVWPEGAAGGSPDTDATIRRQISAASNEVGAPILVGSINRGPTPATRYNQGVLWDPRGPLPAEYTKMHPVPFGEFVPARGLIGDLSMQFDRVPFDMVSGPQPAPMRVGGTSIANAICFDVAYADGIRDQVVAGAEMIIVQTSNASFSGTAQPEQQFAITRARAVETQRSVVVASLNGTSGVISADGSVVRRLRSSAVTGEVVSIPRSRYLTTAVRLGPYLPSLILGGAIAALLGAAAAAGRRRCYEQPGTTNDAKLQPRPLDDLDSHSRS